MQRGGEPGERLLTRGETGPLCALQGRDDLHPRLGGGNLGFGLLHARGDDARFGAGLVGLGHRAVGLAFERGAAPGCGFRIGERAGERGAFLVEQVDRTDGRGGAAGKGGEDRGTGDHRQTE